MSLLDFLGNTWRDVRQDGVAPALRTVSEEILRNGPLRRLDKIGYNRGRNVYEMEWDLLLILDACRADLMAEVVDEYDFVEEFETGLSVASKSQQWLDRTFTDAYADEIARTRYLTANMFSHRVAEHQFELLDELWRTHWDDEIGIVEPRPVTDRVITEFRQNDPDRLIAHYMQPHYPFVPNKLADGVNLTYAHEGKGEERNVWARLEDGEVTHEEVWSAYRENLRYVMDDVELLLQSVDVDSVLVTADHGNSFGTLGVYGHPPLPLRCLREVPFVRASGTDSGEYTPSVTEPTGRGTDADVTARLDALGYT